MGCPDHARNPRLRSVFYTESGSALMATHTHTHTHKMTALVKINSQSNRASVMGQEGFPGGSEVKNPLANGADFDPWVRKIPWKRKWQRTPVLLPGKSHGQRSLVACSPWGHRQSDTTWGPHTTATTTKGPGTVPCTLCVRLPNSEGVAYVVPV